MTTDGQRLEDAYFEWLYSQIGPLRTTNPARTYWHLCRQLHSTRFDWFVPNDDNRVADGLELRRKFVIATRFRVGRLDPFYDLECSVFEMLIALADLAAFESGRPAIEWFGRFMQNLGLSSYTDEVHNLSVGRSLEEGVEEVLETLIERTYRRNGVGGLFPLRHARRDQRKVELWDQLVAYLYEGHYVEEPLLA